MKILTFNVGHLLDMKSRETLANCLAIENNFDIHSIKVIMLTDDVPNEGLFLKYYTFIEMIQKLLSINQNMGVNSWQSKSYLMKEWILS